MIIRSNRLHRFKYMSQHTLVYKDIGIRKSGFVANTQFLCSENQKSKDDLNNQRNKFKKHFLNSDKNSF